MGEQEFSLLQSAGERRRQQIAGDLHRVTLTQFAPQTLHHALAVVAKHLRGQSQTQKLLQKLFAGKHRLPEQQVDGALHPVRRFVCQQTAGTLSPQPQGRAWPAAYQPVACKLDVGEPRLPGGIAEVA